MKSKSKINLPIYIYIYLFLVIFISANQNPVVVIVWCWLAKNMFLRNPLERSRGKTQNLGKHLHGYFSFIFET